MLALLKRITDSGNTHRDGERDLRVADLDLVDARENAELISDALREHLVVENEQKLVGFVLAENSSHRGNPVVKKLSDLARLVLIVDLYVLRDLLEVVDDDISDSRVVIAVTLVDLEKLGNVAENEHVIGLSLRGDGIALNLISHIADSGDLGLLDVAQGGGGELKLLGAYYRLGGDRLDDLLKIYRAKLVDVFVVNSAVSLGSRAERGVDRDDLALLADDGIGNSELIFKAVYNALGLRLGCI